MTLKLSPKVTIAIPVYNGSDYLDQAIASALAQTYKNVEVLVVNDGSDDAGATEAVALKYRDRIRYLSKPNGGVATALNVAVDAMEGEYFSWLSHDDLYLPEKLEVQMDAILAQENSDVILYCDYAVFSDDPRRSTKVEMTTFPPAEFRYWLTTNNVLHGCTLLIPRLAFQKCGKFASNLQTTQDYDLWFRMAECFRFIHLRRSLVLARSHANQGSRKLGAIARKECNELLVQFSRKLSDSEIVGTRSPEWFPLRLAGLSASMFRRAFFQAGFDSMSVGLGRLRRRGLRFVILYLVLLPPIALVSMLISLRSVLLRLVVR